ncbi:MAG: glycosyltransferase family 4 protein, partial [Candidatus Saccharimonadales bacterium]
KVLSVVGERSFDIIHANDWLTFRAATRAKEKTGWPLIAHVHSVESDRSGGHGNPIVRDIEQLTFLLADRIVAVSEHTRQKIIDDYGIPKHKISVVHNSIDINDLEPLGQNNAYYYLKYLKSKGYKVICNLGRQTLQKGLPNLLEAAQQVVNYEPKTVFLLVGDGEQHNELIELAARLGISTNVFFAGFQRGKEVRDAFAVADLFVMPSISEPFGLTPLESVGYGTPTLITKQSGVAEVLHHSLKVDFWDVNEMANQIVGAIRNQSLRDYLLKNAQAELESLSWQQSAEKMLGIYRDFSQVAS